MAGDLGYKVDIDVRSAQRALSSLQSSIAGFGASIASAFAFREFTKVAAQLDDLRRTLGTLYRSLDTGSAAFDDVKKLANELGVDIGALAETVIKLKAAGIEPTAAQLRLFADVAAVSTDKLGALQSITDLFTRTMGGGLGLEELERLQDRGIPVYDILIQKLGKSRLELSEFGKTAKGAEVIRAALQEGLAEKFGGATLERANSLSSSMTRLKNAFQEAADVAGKSGMNEAISDIANTMSSWINRNQELVKSISQGLAGAFKFLLENIVVITKAFATFFLLVTAKKILEIGQAFVGLAKLIRANPIMLVAAAILAAAAATGLLDEAFKAVGEKMKLITGEEVDASLNSTTDAANGLVGSNGFKVLTEGDLGKGTRNFKSEIEALNEKLAIFRREMNDTVEAFARHNQQQRDTLDLDTSLIGATSEYAEVQRQQAEITKRAADEIAKLREQKNKLTEEQLKEGRGKIIEDTIAKIEKQAAADKLLTEQAVKNSESRKMAYALEQFQIQSRIGFEDKLMEIQKEMAQTSMSEIEKKYDDIRRAADASALAAIRAEEARVGRRLTENEAAKYYEEARKSTDVLIEGQKGLYDESRKFETGWNKAFKTYVDDATNAAKQAEMIFQKVTSGMEDMIVNFAKTGKFEFRGFVNSILEDLLRSQIRQTMAQIFNIGNNTGGGSGGLFSGLGKLLGFAGGGIIPTNAPVLVGERGPELLSGAAGRTVIPNDQLGGQTFVTYNISAVDALSFKQLVASDPSFIHAVAAQGAKTVPLTRR